jgi:hypothetical protein
MNTLCRSSQCRQSATDAQADIERYTQHAHTLERYVNVLRMRAAHFAHARDRHIWHMQRLHERVRVDALAELLKVG